MPNQMPIPTDWNEEENGYALYMVCGPNSDQWRRNVKGAIYALTRGRNYDFDTGIFKDIEQLANDLDDSFMSCQLDELVQELANITKTNRMIVAALMGQSVNFDSEPLPNAINYENGIRQAILGIQGALETDMTLQEMKELLESLDLTGTDFLDTLTDIVTILTFLILLWGPTQKVSVAFGWWDKITYKRWQHNSLTIAAHQATSLRGIMRSIAPMKEESEEEETSLWETIGQIPWLARAVVAIAEPTPTGEIALIATTLGGVINNIYQVLKEAYNIWWNKWVNLIEEPEPMDTLTSALSVIANKISTREDIADNPQVSVTNRLDLIAEKLESLDTEGLVPALTLISTILGTLDDMPEGTNWELLFNGLNDKLEEVMAINVNVTCSSCGSSGGCSCGGNGSGPYGPGVGGPSDKPPVEVVTGTIIPGFPDVPSSNTYKCKAANALYFNLGEMLFQLAQQETVNLTQYPNYNTARQVIVDRLSQHTLLGIPLSPTQISWLADKIMLFVWPYPNEDSIALAIFEGIRLEWLSEQEAIVCELYTSNNTGEARDAIEERVDGYIDATGYTNDVKVNAKEMYKGLLTNQWLNRLFEKDAGINGASTSGFASCDDCPDPGLLAQTSMTSPYNVLVKGDSVSPAGDVDGWYNNPTALDIEFTPEVNTVQVQITFEYQNSAPNGFVTGSVALAGWGEINLISDGDAEFEVFDVTNACELEEGVTYHLFVNPSTVHGQVIRKVEVRSIVE